MVIGGAGNGQDSQDYAGFTGLNPKRRFPLLEKILSLLRNPVNPV
jgi:hypothetical protein